MTSSQKSISILGCGWLGEPLSIILKKKYSVKRSPDFLIRVHENFISGNLDFFKSDYLIITLPFKRSFEDPFIYPKQISQIIKHSPKNQWILFTSSTSIYPNINGTVTEETSIIPENNRQKALLETEEMIQAHTPHTLIRLAGLFGPDRPLKKESKNMNLIHLNDAIGIIQRIIETSSQNHIFNAVCLHNHLNNQGKIVDNTKIKTMLGYHCNETEN